MNSVSPWMKVHVNPFSDYDPFHCFDELLTDETVCEFCPYCGVDERFNIQLRVRQHYKGGFELWKDWEEWEDAELFDRCYDCNKPVYLGGTCYIDKDFNLWEGVFRK